MSDQQIDMNLFDTIQNLTKMLSLTTVYGSLQLTIVACIAMLVIFLRRVNTMVDMVANRVFDAYSQFKPGDEQSMEPMISFSELQRFGNTSKQKKFFEKQVDKEIRNKYLFDIKENLVAPPPRNKRPLMGLSCYNCCPNSRESLVNQATQSLSLLNLFNKQAYIPQTNYFQRFFTDFYQGYRVKKYEYPRVEQMVSKDERLRNAIEKTAIEQFHDMNTNNENYYQNLIRKNEKRAYKLLYDMRSTLSDFLLRFTSWVLYKLLPLFLNAVIVHPGQVEMLKKASETGLPIIFIPLHKSHLDYVMVSFILLNSNIRSPIVAAGDNLRIPFFGSLLRGLGAFYIKRRIDPIMGRKDHVYKAVLHTYMNECLRAGHNVEFFLEGGRTRTGKPCMPKYGIFSVIIDAFMDGTIEDALLVPISMNYEKLIDGNFVKEQLGEPKMMETFGLALKSIWSVLNKNYGMMRINFNQPFSLRELVKTFNTSGKVEPSNGYRDVAKLISRPSTTSLYGTDVVSEEHKLLVQCISKHVLYDCATSTAIMSTNAVAFLLLNRFRDGVQIDEFISAMDQLRKELTQSGLDLGFSGETEDVIRYTIDLLGPGVIQIDSNNFIKPITMLPNVIELSYYSNCLMQHYVVQAIIATALSAMDFTSSGFVLEEDLMHNCLDIIEILQFEFIICKPCQSNEETILNAIDDFVTRSQIFIQNDNSAESVRNKRIAEEYLDVDEIDERPPAFQISLDETCMKQLKFLRNLLRPWIEPYSASALVLEKLIGESLLEPELVKEVLAEMKNQFNEGHIYGESVSADSIKNALKLFQHWDIIECHTEERVRLMYLKDQYDNSSSIKELYERLNKYRIN